VKTRKYQNYHQIRRGMQIEADRTGRTVEAVVYDPGKRRR
jgi:hypothetical protein